MAKVVFVSFRLKAQDGVSVEAEKWIGLFRERDCEVHRVAGYIANPAANDHVIGELNFCDPQIEHFTRRVFSSGGERDNADEELAQLTQSVKASLEPVLDEVGPDLVIAENVLSLPLNIPLTISLCRYLEDRGIPTIAIHHDFYWQDAGYASCILDGVLARYFPPPLPNIRHVTINDMSREELYERTGMTAACIRNCFDFDAVRRKDQFNSSLRQDLGIGEDEVMFLQPTRVIERKGISRSIGFVEEFAAACGKSVRLVITGPCEQGYESSFKKLCHAASVDVMHTPNWFGNYRNQPGTKLPYDIRDAYAHCDMVIFPSIREGFGNPVLESVVHRKPLLVSLYPALEELRAYGFQFLVLDERAVERTIKLLDYPPLMVEMVDRNFNIGRRHFSVELLKEQIAELVSAMPAQVYQ